MHLYHVCTNGMERLYFLVRTLLSHERRVRDMSSTGLREEHPPMGQITALSGETLAELDKDVFARMVEDGQICERPQKSACNGDWLLKVSAKCS